MNNQKLAKEIEQLKHEIFEIKSNKGFKGFMKKSFSKFNILIGVGLTIFLTSIVLWAAQITFTDGTVISATDVNNNFTELFNKTKNISPIGSIMAWHKSLNGTPALSEGWVECNGQVINDTESHYNGETLPDLNNNNNFLRGNMVSGTTGGSETHNHGVRTPVGGGFTSSGSRGTDSGSSLPPYFDVVWIIKIK
jgi:hypothetical protein